MTKSIGIVGAGLMGRVLSCQLTLAGFAVTLFDCDQEAGTLSCAYTGAGMLAPVCELADADEIICCLGLDALPRWRNLLSQLNSHGVSPAVFFQEAGSLVVAHGYDREDYQRFYDRTYNKLSVSSLGAAIPELLQEIDQERLAELEPELSQSFHEALWMPTEGQIDNRQILEALAKLLHKLNVTWLTETLVTNIEPGLVWLSDKKNGQQNNQKKYQFDCVVDCRGLGAKPDLPKLRGVRGELIVVDAPQVRLNRPIRLMHPRHPIYIVPRAEQRYLIGATTIESDDTRPVSVQSALELLSAAFTVHPGFADASIVELRCNARPALPDNLPLLTVNADAEGNPQLIRINGLYRHGFLIAPALAHIAQSLITAGSLDEHSRSLFGSIVCSTNSNEAYHYAAHH